MRLARAPRAPVLTLNALGGKGALDAPLLSCLLQRALLAREEERRREEEAEEQELVGGARVRRAFLATSHAVLL